MVIGHLAPYSMKMEVYLLNKAKASFAGTPCVTVLCVGLSLHMEDDFELNKASQNNPQAQCLYTIYLVAKLIVEIASGKHKSKNPS